MFNKIKQLHEWPVILGLLIGIFFFSSQIVGPELKYFPGDLGDARFNMYALENAHHFISGRQESLWNAEFMIPEKDVVTYSVNSLGTAPFYSIFRVLGFDTHTSFQLWFILIQLLNYFFAYLFLKYVFKDRRAAVIGALIFAFSMALQSQMTHAQTFTRFPIPLIFLMLYRFTDKLNPKYFLFACLLISYQFYCGIYLGLMICIPFAIFLIFSLIFQRHIFFHFHQKGIWLTKMILGGLVSVVSLLPIMLPYFERSKTTGLNSYEYIFPTIPTVHSHVFSQRGSLLWDFLSVGAERYQAYWDHQIFAGLITTASFLVFLFWMFRKMKVKSEHKRTSTDWKYHKTFLITALLTFLFFIRIGNFSFYEIIFKSPGFGAMRSLTRIINIELIFFSFAAAWIWTEMKIKFNANVLFVVVLGLWTLDNFYPSDAIYRSEKQESISRLEELREKMIDIPKGSVVSYEPQELESMPHHQQLDAMLIGQELDLKMVNAYTSTSPPSYTNFWFKMDSTSRQEWFDSVQFSTDNLYVVK